MESQTFYQMKVEAYFHKAFRRSNPSLLCNCALTTMKNIEKP